MDVDGELNWIPVGVQGAQGGQGQVAAASTGAGSLALSFAPPFPLFIISLSTLGFGCGLFDATLTTLISHDEDATSMSFLYAAFGVSARPGSLRFSTKLSCPSDRSNDESFTCWRTY